MTREAELSIQIRELQDELNAIHKQRGNEETASLVGGFFYANSTYAAVTGADGLRLNGWSFGTDLSGGVEIELKTQIFRTFATEKNRVSRDAFLAAWNTLLRQLHLHGMMHSGENSA